MFDHYSYQHDYQHINYKKICLDEHFICDRFIIKTFISSHLSSKFANLPSLIDHFMSILSKFNTINEDYPKVRPITDLAMAF